jgi:ssRNA-specific RNase YbeY (16S rRNA maturation enzyme)
LKQPQQQQQQQQPESVPLNVTTNQYSGMSRVVASDLRNFVKSKQDLYIILTIEGQLHLPPYDDCSMEFMREALAGRKKLLTNRDLCSVNVPRYKEFNATNLQNLAMQDNELRVYLPDTSDNKVINRRFLFNVSRASRHTSCRSSTQSSRATSSRRSRKRSKKERRSRRSRRTSTSR